MVFPFKQLRLWASRKQREGKNSDSDADSHECRPPTSSVFPISFPTPTIPSAPCANGEGETRAYLAGDPYALTSLYHAQAVAAEKSRRATTRAHPSNGYSIRAMGQDPTLALATHPDDPQALGQLRTQMDEAGRLNKQGGPKLPRFHRDTGGFVSLRDLIGREVDLVTSPTHSAARGSLVSSLITEDTMEDAVADPDRLPLNIPSQIGGQRDKEAIRLCGPYEVCSTSPLAVDGFRAASANTLEDEAVEEVEEVEEEYVRPPSRWSASPSCSDSDNSCSRDEMDDDDDDDDDGFGEPFSLSQHNLRQPQIVSATQGVDMWRSQVPRRPPTPYHIEDADDNPHPRARNPTYDPRLPTVYARILPLPSRPPPTPRRLTRSTAHIGPRLSGPLRHRVTTVPPARGLPSPQSATPQWHYTHPEGRARLSRITQYLSLPAAMPPCELLLYLLKLDRSVRAAAARACPALDAGAREVDWEGVDREVVALPYADERAFRWDMRMVATFLQAQLSLFTWDAEDGGDGGGGSDRVVDVLPQYVAAAVAGDGGGAGEEQEQQQGGEDLREKFRVQFKKRSESLACRRDRSESPRKLFWEKPGRSPLARTLVSEREDGGESGIDPWDGGNEEAASG